MPDREVTATPLSSVIEYEIEYENIEWVDVDNPTIYTVETETFTLREPNRTWYVFVWWTWSNGDNPEATVTIAQWSRYENLVYYASWKEDFNGNGVADELETKYKVTVNYEYSRWWEAAWSVSGMYLSGIAFNFVSPEIPNYTANSWTVSGTWKEEAQTFTVIYTPNHDENGDGIADEEEWRYTVTINYVYSRWWEATWSYTTW
jgi:hypothetical protein